MSLLTETREPQRTAATRLVLPVVWTMLALPCLFVVLARALGGHPPTPGPQLAALVLPALGLMIIAMVLALVVRRGMLVAASTLLFVPLAVWAAPPRGASAAPACNSGASLSFRAMTINAYFGRADPEQILRTVQDEQVDVLAVQELTPALADELRSIGLDKELPYSNIDPRDVAAGSGLWLRYRAQPSASLSGLSFAAPTMTVRVGTEETVTFASVHPSSPWPGREWLWEKDLQTLGLDLMRISGEKVVMGDFNASRDHADFRAVLAANDLHDAADLAKDLSWPGATWPAGGVIPSFTRLDHVLVSPVFGVQSAEPATIAGSDHKAVLATLTVCGGPAGS